MANGRAMNSTICTTGGARGPSGSDSSEIIPPWAATRMPLGGWAESNPSLCSPLHACATRLTTGLRPDSTYGCACVPGVRALEVRALGRARPRSCTERLPSIMNVLILADLTHATGNAVTADRIARHLRPTHRVSVVDSTGTPLAE